MKCSEVSINLLMIYITIMKKRFQQLTILIFSFLLVAISKTCFAQEEVDLKLPHGFSANIVAKNFGRVRHIAMHSNGDLFLKLERLFKGNGIIRLRDSNHDGIFDDTLAFGNYIGTGITIKDKYLYASSNSAIFRYTFNESNEIENIDNPDVIVEGLWDKRQHASKSIVLDNEDNIYVNIGAPSNACQENDRQKGSPGMNPCPLLDSAGGIWQFKSNQFHQSYSNGIRYATGLRNVVGLDWNENENALYVMQHGRDMLFQFYPDLYNSKMGAELPAEEMFRIKKGADYGYPYCYYDQFQKKKILAPEYGGDGKIEGVCATKEKPLMAFPGHLAPNALLFYTGNQFPEKYKNGAFIAFHGSWNRNPENQEGYFVAFVPFKNGVPNGDWEIFANNFAAVSEIKSTRDAKHRPCGLAEGIDGSLYVSDDAKGYVWKIEFKN